MAEIFERSGRMVRPYAITGGRTAVAIPDLMLETPVLATSLGRNSVSSLRWEAAKIVEVCSEATALVEISARVGVPVGVVRVIVSDLAIDRLLTIVEPQDEAGENDSYAQLLEKVLDGIRSL